MKVGRIWRPFGWIGRTVPLLALLIALWPQQASAWWNDDWSLRKKITLDTGASGAGITDAIGRTPVLVRLHVGNFRFGTAKEDGSDLRFVAGDDKTPLKYHIEKYDSLIGEALVWVSVPDLKQGAKNEIWLYYGNAKATSAADVKGSYDPETLLVYHFADRGTPAQDATAWGNAAQALVPAADGSIIGQGARFDGQTALTVPSGNSLVVAEGGEMTWSVWLKMTAPQPNAVLYARREGGNALTIGLDNGVPFVEVTRAGAAQRSGTGTAISAASWHHLAVTAKGGQIAVYVDGNPFSTLATPLPAIAGAALIGRDVPATSVDGVAAPAPGGDAAAPAAPEASTDAAAAVPAAAAPLTGFAGDLDELQIAKVARPAGFIKVAAIGQGPEQGKLIAFSVDEETASWFSGYFAVILKSVTLDGWVVIGILAVMAVISWIVMIDKVSYLNRIAKANKLFLVHFRASSGDLDELIGMGHHETEAPIADRVTATDHKTIHRAPLFRLFGLGATEIRRRFSSNGGQRSLSPQSIAAIRAVLDSGFMQESQRLNRLMVMLTIAISGGPFLGLLGTVVGVMITFAAIAASGDVNVNAIAPGIAAALVATVAGLGVAIPALFGYNYLITRIKDVTVEMQVFVDELVTKMAESYDKPVRAR
jgi:biopolymer transport protein ExbB